MILIVSSSLNSESNSRILAHETRRILEDDGHAVAFLDLREYPLPLCDGGPSYQHPNVQRVNGLLTAASTIILATPIYNYDGTAALKNLIELTGNAWENKTVGFLCAAAGMSSYMSIMSLASSLMLDFRSLILPRFVYATAAAFTGDKITDEKVVVRVADLARAAAKLDRQLKAA
jgi:FMN reductase